MTQTTYTDNVVIDGSEDEIQLDVQGHSTQTSSLQTWKDSTGAVLAQVLGDGRIRAGDDLGSETEDAQVEIHRETSTLPKRGLGTLGKIAVATSTIVQWIAHELRLTGSTDIDDQHTAMRVQLTNENTGKLVSGGELRAGDFEVVNNAGGTPLAGTAIGLRAAVHNTTTGVANEAIGLEVDVQDENTTNPIPDGNITGIKINDVGNDNIALETGTGQVLIGGKVGIGTNLAQSTLDVNGDAGISGDLAITGDITFENTKGIYFQPDGVGSRWYMVDDGGVDLDFYYIETGTTPHQRLTMSNTGVFTLFDNSGTELFQVAANGNVGIGTTSPTTKLEVNGDIELGSGGNGAKFGNWKWRNDGSDDLDLAWYNGSSWINRVLVSDTGHLIYYDESGAECVRFESGGEVGIGTNSPDEKLHVIGNIQADNAVKIGKHPSYTSYGAIWKGSESYALLWNSSNTFLNARGTGNIYFREDNNDLMVLTNTGRLGIGTTSPSYPLHINNTNAGVYGYVTILDANNDPGYLFGEGLGTSQYGYMLWLRASNRIRMGIGGDGDKFYIESGRLLSMVDFDPASNNLQSIGNGGQRWKEIYVNSVWDSSDERRKINIEDTPVGLDFINNLRPVSYQEAPFTWIDENGNEHTETPEDKLRFGLVAQEIVNAVQNSGLDTERFSAVRYDEDYDAYSVNYIQFVPILIQALKELADEVNSLKSGKEIIS